MGEDSLKCYHETVLKSLVPDGEKISENDLLFRSHYKRLAAYSALLNAQSLCSNPTTCLILKSKLKEYSSLIDDRKGINNFASVARSIANNVTNVSKQWTSRLDTFRPDIPLDQVLKQHETSGSCENMSAQGCTASVPHQIHLDNFFNVLSHIKNESRSALAVPSNNHHASSDGSMKKTRLYSTYEDSFLDRMKKDTVSNPSSLHKEISFNSLLENRLETIPCKLKNDFVIKPCDKFYNPSNDSKKIECERISLNKRMNSAERIKKLTKDRKQDEDERRQIDFFKTASETLKIQEQKKFGAGQQYNCQSSSGAVKKSLGGKGRGASNRFVPPLRSSQEEDCDMLITRSVLGRSYPNSGGGAASETATAQPEDERLRHIDPKMVEMIRSEIMDHGSTVTWDDIAGLQFAKHTIQEIVVWPMLRPDIFTGLRRPPKGILLFGPPGTGKTLIGKCIASQSKSTFFSISASSLTSKWIGDGEKMVRALFAVARVEQPSVIFIDEIDSLLSQRSDQEHESSRRIKTEFLVQLDGAATGDDDRLLIIGATNRPQELDEAARRRLVKRLYIPLPDHAARKQLTANLMKKERNDLTDEHLEEVATLTDGYSGADMMNLCQEASLGPIRSLSASLIAHIDPQQVRAVNIEDFKQALKRVRSSVSNKDLDLYIEWDRQFGMSS